MPITTGGVVDPVARLRVGSSTGCSRTPGTGRRPGRVPWPIGRRTRPGSSAPRSVWSSTSCGDQVAGAPAGPAAGAAVLVLLSRMVLVIRARARPARTRAMSRPRDRSGHRQASRVFIGSSSGSSTVMGQSGACGFRVGRARPRAAGRVAGTRPGRPAPARPTLAVRCGMGSEDPVVVGEHPAVAVPDLPADVPAGRPSRSAGGSVTASARITAAARRQARPRRIRIADSRPTAGVELAATAGLIRGIGSWSLARPADAVRTGGVTDTGTAPGLARRGWWCGVGRWWACSGRLGRAGSVGVTGSVAVLLRVADPVTAAAAPAGQWSEPSQAGHRPAPLVGQQVRVAGGGVGQHAGDAFDRSGQDPGDQRGQGEDDHPGGRVELDSRRRWWG